LGTLTTIVSFIVMGLTLALVWLLGRGRKGRASA
ncbi:MAG: transporter permease, partial [Rhodoferax sp.]|nr:transporter permease [Rhodoferax sp.]